MNSLIDIKTCCFSIDLVLIQIRNISLPEIAVLPVELRKIGLNIIKKELRPHKEEIVNTNF